ncbi:hypothetical protein VTL71DRAFT_659 [Oculimacula yallundae]|uniref:Uncharacterized protein n=1 Tax=Oculimacula yallundae TaxID=86028 RepID=A0ABR4D0Q2_9HELO
MDIAKLLCDSSQANGTGYSAQQPETSVAPKSNTDGQVVSGHGLNNSAPMGLPTAPFDGEQARKNQSKPYGYVSSPEANSPSPSSMQLEANRADSVARSSSTVANSEIRHASHNSSEPESPSHMEIDSIPADSVASETSGNNRASCICRKKGLYIRPGAPTIMCRVYGQRRERLMVDDFENDRDKHDAMRWDKWRLNEEERHVSVPYYEDGDSDLEWEDFQKERGKRAGWQPETSHRGPAGVRKRKRV